MSGEISQPVTTEEVAESYTTYVGDASRVSQRAIREIITDLETMGLVQTWIQSTGAEGRVKQIETTFDPEWVREAKEPCIDQSPNIQQHSRIACDPRRPSRLG